MAVIHSALSGVAGAGIQICLVYGRFSNSSRAAHGRTRTACSDVSERRFIWSGGVTAGRLMRAGAGQMPSPVREIECISATPRKCNLDGGRVFVVQPASLLHHVTHSCEKGQPLRGDLFFCHQTQIILTAGESESLIPSQIRCQS